MDKFNKEGDIIFYGIWTLGAVAVLAFLIYVLAT